MSETVRIRDRFVRGQITLNQYIRAMERLASLAKDDTTTNPEGSQ